MESLKIGGGGGLSDKCDQMIGVSGIKIAYNPCPQLVIIQIVQQCIQLFNSNMYCNG